MSIRLISLNSRDAMEKCVTQCDDVAMDADDGEPVGYQLGRVVLAIRATTTAALAPLGLTFPQYVCMRVLRRTPGQSNAELSRATYVSPQSMHVVLQALEDAELLERPAEVEFGRARPARLTRRGLALLTRAENAVRAAEERFLSRLSPRRQTEFKRALAILDTDSTHI